MHVTFQVNLLNQLILLLSRLLWVIINECDSDGCTGGTLSINHGCGCVYSYSHIGMQHSFQ